MKKKLNRKKNKSKEKSWATLEKFKFAGLKKISNDAKQRKKK